MQEQQAEVEAVLQTKQQEVAEAARQFEHAMTNLEKVVLAHAFLAMLCSSGQSCCVQAIFSYLITVAREHVLAMAACSRAHVLCRCIMQAKVGLRGRHSMQLSRVRVSLLQNFHQRPLLGHSAYSGYTSFLLTPPSTAKS